MPDQEKVVSVLGEIAAYFRSTLDAMDDGMLACEVFRRYAEAAENALALLKAQKPLEPVIVNGEPECAECLYELRSDADSYCPCCGRKVKWE